MSGKRDLCAWDCITFVGELTLLQLSQDWDVKMPKKEERITQGSRLAGQRLADGEKDLHWKRRNSDVTEGQSMTKMLARRNKAKIKQGFF